MNLSINKGLGGRASKLDLIYLGYLVYYWILLSFYDRSAGISNAMFFLMTLPAVGLIAANYRLLVRRNVSFVFFLLYVYLFFIAFVNVVRGQYDVVVDSVFFVLPVIIVSRLNVSVFVGHLNLLFILSVIVSIFFYHVGLGHYGYLPGHAGQHVHMGYDYRISLFPFLAPVYSGVFALSIFIANWFNRAKWYSVVLPFSLYYAVLSGSRTVWVVLVFFVVVIIADKVSRFFGRRVLYWCVIVYVVLFFCVSYYPIVVLSIIGSVFGENSSLAVYLYRDQYVVTDDGNIASRALIWSEYLSVFKLNPFIGAGLQGSNSDWDLLSRDWTEVYFVYLMARDGLLVLFFYFFWVLLFINVLRDYDLFRLNVLFLLIMVMLNYGSFSNMYNFVFLVLIFFVFGRVRGENSIRRVVV